MLSLSVLLFEATFVQYWVKKFLTDVMHVSETQADLSFLITCVTAPLAGIMFGGCVIQKIGGYESYKSTYYCIGATMTCGGLGIGIGFIGANYLPFQILLWLYLFSGGSIVPCLVGTVLWSLPHELKGSGNSLCLLITSLLGYTPAPYIYSIIFEASKDSYPNLAMMICLSYALVGTLVQCIVLRLRFSRESSQVDDTNKERINSDSENISETTCVS